MAFALPGKGYSDRPASSLASYTTKSSRSLPLRKVQRKCLAPVMQSLSRGMDTVAMVKRWLYLEKGDCKAPEGPFASQFPTWLDLCIYILIKKKNSPTAVWKLGVMV